MFHSGDKIGPYVLKAQIGRGAFGVVWLAEETTFLASHSVALKLPSDAQVNIEAIRQEAALWEQVKGHPNILPIIKADVIEGQIYIASEYAPDGSLFDWIENHQGSAPTIFAAIEMTKGILAGLAHLHLKSVIHRDLKPENILLQGEIPRIADFGIARIIKDSHSSQIAGTPSYMAPEGFNGVRSEQTDLWAVGVIFYQMLTGLLPYPQTDLMSMMKAIVYDQPEIHQEKIPDGLRSIICQALEKNVSDRYSSVAMMRDDLRKFDSGAFENVHAAITIPDFDFPGGEPIRGLKTAQNAETVKTTRKFEPFQPTAQENLETQVMGNSSDAIAAPKKHYFLKFGGGILSAAILGGAVFTEVNLLKSTTGDPESANVSVGANIKTPAPQDDLYNRSLWAEWALMLEEDEYEKIIRETTAEIERNPNNIIAYRMRATAYGNMENHQPARMDIREVLRLSTNPATAEEYESYCYALKIINKPDEALVSCTKAIELDSQMALAYNIRGTIYHQKQKFDLAVNEYTKAIELSPRKTFFQNRALAYRELGQIRLAAKDEREAKIIENFRAANPSAENRNQQTGSTQPTPDQFPKPMPRPLPQKPMPMPTPRSTPKPQILQ